MLCLCDYILNILHSLLELVTKLSEHPKRESVRKTYFCFQHQTLFTTTTTIHYVTVIDVIGQAAIVNKTLFKIAVIFILIIEKNMDEKPQFS